jgi:hypothetical protein
MKILINLIVLLLFVNNISIAQQIAKEFPKLTSPYLGQTPPGLIPELFAPGIVSTGNHEHSSPVFTPDLKEMYWSTILVENGKLVGRPTYFMKLINGVWSKPEIPSFAKNYPSCDNPFISPDGKKLFFAASDSFPPTNYDLYYVNRVGDGWSDPLKMDEPINTPNREWELSVSKNGTIYYAGYAEKTKEKWKILYSELINGKYPNISILEINNPKGEISPYIAPDESYIIFSSNREEGFGMSDLYICFRNSNGKWSNAINMGDKINTGLIERFPNVSPDGKYLFFNRLDSKDENKGDFKDGYGNGWGDVFWVDARIIEELKPKELK